MDCYDNLLQDIYEDILQKQHFTGKRGNFVRVENGMVQSIRFASWYDKNHTLTFRISAEVRFENEAQLRREDKIAGKGCYREYFPRMPQWTKQDDRWIFDDRDLLISNCFRIGEQTDIEGIKDTVKTLLEDALHRAMQFQTQEDLAAFVKADYKRSADACLRRNWAQTRRTYLGLGMISFLCIVAGRGLLMPILLILLEIYCSAVTIADMRSQRWLRRMIVFPIAELLILALLLGLISADVIGTGAAIQGLCIALFGSGLISLVIQCSIMVLRNCQKRQERKIRWLR